MKDFNEKDVRQFLKAIKEGMPGVILCISEESIAEFGNDIDAEILIEALQQYSLIITAGLSINIFKRDLKA